MAKNSFKQTEVLRSNRLRHTALWILFALVLLIPKTLSLRKRPGVWNLLRFGVAVLGVLLFAAPEASIGFQLFALLLILLALAVRPTRQGKSVDEQARELGALVVLNGGRFLLTDGMTQQARLFVAPERFHVLDFEHRPLLEIPWIAVSSVSTEEASGGWKLLVEFQETIAAFHYDGFFAGHLAQIAETTLRNHLRKELPVIR